MAWKGVGIGIGTKKFARANCVRTFLGESGESGRDLQAEHCAGRTGEITELVCNIDDMTPEALAFACARLLELGALDVYTVPGTMKKGRPGHVLTVLCAPDKEKETARNILAQTTTNGVRARRCGKYYLEPGSRTVQTRWGEIRIKTASGFGITHEKPEYEDAARLAAEHGVPYREVYEEAARKYD